MSSFCGEIFFLINIYLHIFAHFPFFFAGAFFGIYRLYELHKFIIFKLWGMLVTHRIFALWVARLGVLPHTRDLHEVKCRDSFEKIE